MPKKLWEVFILGGVVLSIANCGALFNRSKINYYGMKAFHQGWNGVQALGGRQPVSQATGLVTTSPTVTLSWNAMSFPYANIDSYNIYRSTISGGQDFTNPLATGIAASALTYTDTSVATSTTYYYTVRPVAAGYALATAEADTEIKVIVPPVNTALVHRWMANQEICGLMNRSVDRNNNYRCVYSGPASTNGYYDLGGSIAVDVAQVGCNFTPAPGCGDSINGCLGISGAAPSNGIGLDGNVFYDRNSQTCYLKVSGIWTAANSLSSDQFDLLGSSQPGLPPLVLISQDKSGLLCQKKTTGSTISSSNKRLLSKKEWTAAAAWSASFSDTVINTIESGGTLPLTQTGYCNSIVTSGLTFDNNVTPNDQETLPTTLSTARTFVRTGSNATKNCVSRYGIQDLVGNAWSWVSDQLTCDGTSCVGISSTVNSNNSDINGFSFDGVTGPNVGGSFADTSGNATQFVVPLGLPLMMSAPSSYGGIKIGTDQGSYDPAKFHNDSYVLFAFTAGLRGITMGGAYSNLSGNGRYRMAFRPPNTTLNFIGLRCAFSIEN